MSDILVDGYEIAVVQVQLVRTGILYIILYSTLASLLFVLASVVVLKHGLSPRKRRLPTAWIVGLAMTLGLIGSVTNTAFWSLTLANELRSPKRIADFYAATTSLLFITPLVAHVALIFRLLDLHPPTLANTRRRVLVVTFPVLMTCVRIVAIGGYLVDGHRTVANHGIGGIARPTIPGKQSFWPPLEQAASLAELLYISTILAIKFKQFKGHSSPLLRPERSCSQRYFNCLRQGLYAIAFSYAFSTAYQVVVLGVTCSSQVSATIVGYILVSNIYVQVFGAVLATLSSSHRWKEERFTASCEPSSSIVRRLSCSDAGNSEFRRPSHTSITFSIPRRASRARDLEADAEKMQEKKEVILSSKWKRTITIPKRPKTGDSDVTRINYDESTSSTPSSPLDFPNRHNSSDGNISRSRVGSLSQPTLISSSPSASTDRRPSAPSPLFNSIPWTALAPSTPTASGRIPPCRNTYASEEIPPHDQPEPHTPDPSTNA